MSRLDHDANIRPWVQAAARAGAAVRWAEVDMSDGRAARRAVRRAAVRADPAGRGDRGEQHPRHPARRGGDHRQARAAGALSYVDGVHATPHTPVDVRALGADFYATSAYKWSGPHIGAVIADPALLETAPARTSSPPRRTPCRNGSSWAPRLSRTWPG